MIGLSIGVYLLTFVNGYYGAEYIHHAYSHRNQLVKIPQLENAFLSVAKFKYYEGEREIEESKAERREGNVGASCRETSNRTIVPLFTTCRSALSMRVLSACLPCNR